MGECVEGIIDGGWEGVIGGLDYFGIEGLV